MKKKAMNAKGDVFNAKGDVFNAKGDVFNAKGDVFNATKITPSFYHKANPLLGKTQAEIDVIYASKPYDADYYDWLDNYYEPETATQDKNRFYTTISDILGLTDKAVDIKNKFETGTTVNEGPVSMDMQLGGEERKGKNTIWYVLGGMVVVLVVVGVVASRKKK
jgi:LPXTG-motif cell wall-anchored protein